MAPDRIGVGSQIAGYRLASLLGRGGMGEVYLAEDLRLDRQVALKLLAPRLADDPGFVRRFLRESRLMASVDHPNVLPVYEAGDANGRLYIAMRFVQGGDLKTELLRKGQLDPDTAVAIIEQIAAALDAAHARGLIHRDVKPANILTTGSETGPLHVYLSDFGVVKDRDTHEGLTQTGAAPGTLDYMAPEQIHGEDVDGRTDTYALACVLFQCLTGMTPFRGTDIAVMLGHLETDPPLLHEQRPELPHELSRVIARAMSKEPGRRYATSGEFAQAARSVITTAPRARVRNRPRISRAAAIAVALGAVSAAAATWILTTSSPHSHASRSTTQSAISWSQARRSLTGAELAPVALDFSPAAFAPVNGDLWVTSWSRPILTRVDADGTLSDRRIRLPGVASDLAAAGGMIYAAGVSDRTHGAAIFVVNLATARTSHVIAVPKAGIKHIAAVGGRLWAGYASERRHHSVYLLQAFDPRSGVPLTTPRAVGDGPFTAAGSIWVVSRDHARLIELNGRSGKPMSSVAAPGVHGIAFTPPYFWIAVRDGVQALDPETMTTVGGSIAVGKQPSVYADPGGIWTASATSGEMKRLDPQSGKVLGEARFEPALTSGSEQSILGGTASSIWVADVNQQKLHHFQPPILPAPTGSAPGGYYQATISGSAVTFSKPFDWPIDWSLSRTSRYLRFDARHSEIVLARPSNSDPLLSFRSHPGMHVAEPTKVRIAGLTGFHEHVSVDRTHCVAGCRTAIPGLDLLEGSRTDVYLVGSKDEELAVAISSGRRSEPASELQSFLSSISVDAPPAVGIPVLRAQIADGSVTAPRRIAAGPYRVRLENAGGDHLIEVDLAKDPPNTGPLTPPLTRKGQVSEIVYMFKPGAYRIQDNNPAKARRGELAKLEVAPSPDYPWS